MQFTFSSDPEFMIADKKNNYKSAIGIVPGSNHRRFCIPPHEFFYDNVLAECAIHYGESKEEVIHNFRDCFKKYADLIAPYKLVPKASCLYPKEELQSRAALEVGCNPETCAYTFQDFQKDECLFANTQLRTAGGHIHLGNSIIDQYSDCQKNYYNRLFLVRMLDLFLAIPFVQINNDASEKMRKQIYGQAGRYREKPYGIEYRTLGNFWLSSPKLVSLVYDICEFSLNFIYDERHYELWSVDFESLENDANWESEDFNVVNCHQCHAYNSNDLRAIISNMDKKQSNEFLKIIKKQMPNKLYASIIEAFNGTKYNFYKEWKL